MNSVVKVFCWKMFVLSIFTKYGDKLYFYNKAVEVDFYIPEEAYAVQASYTVMAEETRETYNREVDALKK